MQDEWLNDPLTGYSENARHLFGYPDSTLGEYLRDLLQFLRWLSGEEDGSDGDHTLRLLAVSRDEVEQYVVHLSDRGLRATTINRKIARQS